MVNVFEKQFKKILNLVFCKLFFKLLKNITFFKYNLKFAQHSLLINVDLYCMKSILKI